MGVLSISMGEINTQVSDVGNSTEQAEKRNRKFYLCTGQAVAPDQLGNYPKSHIIGELRYVLDEGKRVTALAVYETSRLITSVPSELPELRAEIIGDARRIKCTCCENRERWEIGVAAVKQILRKYIPE